MLDVVGVHGLYEVEALDTTPCPTLYQAFPTNLRSTQSNDESNGLVRGVGNDVHEQHHGQVLAKAWYAAHFPFPVLHPCISKLCNKTFLSRLFTRCLHWDCFAPPPFHRHTQPWKGQSSYPRWKTCQQTTFASDDNTHSGCKARPISCRHTPSSAWIVNHSHTMFSRRRAQSNPVSCTCFRFPQKLAAVLILTSSSASQNPADGGSTYGSRAGLPC